MRKVSFLSAVAASILMLGAAASPARADFEVQLSFGGATVTFDATTSTTTTAGGASTAGATVVYAPGTITVFNLVVSPTGTTGGFKISATIADSNSPGSSTATIDLSSLTIKNQSGATGTLTIRNGDTGFTSPTGPSGILQSSISASAAGTNGSNATVVWSSFIDTTNAQFGMQQGIAGEPVTLIIGPGGTKSSDLFGSVTPSPTPYSMTEKVSITLANGNSLTDLSGVTTLAVPEPATMAMLLSATPLLGLGCLRGRRKRNVADREVE